MAKKSDFNTWYEKFKPELVKSLDSEDVSPKMYETYGEDLKIVCHTADNNHRKLWTLLDCDGKLYLSPGFHIVNRLNYFICENSWNENTKDYKY